MREAIHIFYAYIVIGVFVMLGFYKTLTTQAAMMSNGDKISYVFLVLGFVFGWPVVLSKIIKDR